MTEEFKIDGQAEATTDEQQTAGQATIDEQQTAGQATTDEQQTAEQATTDEQQSDKQHISGQASEADSQDQLTIRGHTMDRSTVLKFAGLIVFIVLIGVVVAVMWPYIADIFTEGGVDRLVERVRSAGVGGVFILLGMQLLQIIVAVIPGEVVQLAAGLMYGPLLGALVVLLGCLISSAIVYKLVHALGAPFVQNMVSTEHLEKFHKFEESGKLDIVVFVLFLIPAMPKDVFTYLVPLTNMKMGRFLTLATLGRVPGVLASTYVAHGLSQGDIVGPVAIVAIVAIIAIVAVVFRDKILAAFGKGK